MIDTTRLERELELRALVTRALDMADELGHRDAGIGLDKALIALNVTDADLSVAEAAPF